MARHLRAAIAQVKAQAPLCRLPVDVDQFAGEVGHQWRDRPLTPTVTIVLFMLEVAERARTHGATRSEWEPEWHCGNVRQVVQQALRVCPGGAIGITGSRRMHLQCRGRRNCLA